MKILINPRYEHLRPFVERLTRPIFFTRHGETLHSGRNTVKLFETDGMRLVVKSYERLSLFNRFAYGLLRKSKAMRAYRHAGQLRRLGIDPELAGALRHAAAGADAASAGNAQSQMQAMNAAGAPRDDTARDDTARDDTARDDEAGQQ